MHNFSSRYFLTFHQIILDGIALSWLNFFLKMGKKLAISFDCKSEIVSDTLVDGTFVRELREFMSQMTGCMILNGWLFPPLF